MSAGNGYVMYHPETQCLKTIKDYYCLWIYGLSQGVLLFKVELTRASVVTHVLSGERALSAAKTSVGCIVGRPRLLQLGQLSPLRAPLILQRAVPGLCMWR